MKTIYNLETALQTIEATEMGTPHHNMAEMSDMSDTGMDFVMERAYVRDIVSTDAYPELFHDVPKILNLSAVMYGAKPVYED